MVSRAVKESPVRQGEDEQLVYTITTTPWASTPTSVAVVAWDISAAARSNVSTTVLSGSASVLGDIITLPIVKSLTAGNMYRIEVKFTAGGSVWEAYFDIQAEN